MRRRWRVGPGLLTTPAGRLAGLLALASGAQLCGAQELPVPALELGTHSETVNAAFAASGSMIISASDDKTARLWDANSGRLLKIFRVPRLLQRSVEGQLLAAAVSPDGRFAVVSGNTRTEDQTHAIFSAYVYSLKAAGDVPIMRLDGFSTPAIQMRFSRDGRYLATLHSLGGPLRVLDWSSLEKGAPPAPILPSLPADEHAISIDFTVDGDLLAVTTKKRLIRLARASNFQISQSGALDDWEAPSQLRISPDGKYAALGNRLTPKVRIVEVATLRPYATVEIPSATTLDNVFTIAWTAQSNGLLIGGGNGRGTGGALIAIDLNEPQKARRLLALRRRVVQLDRIADDRFVFSTAEPGLGSIDWSGRSRWRWRAPLALAPADGAQLLLSADGSQVLLSREQGGAGVTPLVQINLAASGEKVLSSSTETPGGFKKWPMVREGWTGQISEHHGWVTINGHDVPLDQGEAVDARAFGPDDGTYLLGSNFAIRRVNRSGELVWKTFVSCEAFRLAVSGDGRVFAAWMVDGTLRWFRYQDGVELASALIMEDLKDWIVWLPSGYYMSSPSGDNFFGWSLNRPMARGRPVPFAQFYRASQFERLLYRPDVVLEYVKRLGRVDVAGLAGAAGFQVTQLDTIAPPDIQIAELHSTDPGMAKVKVSIGSSNLPIADWNLFVNEIPVLSHEQRAAFLKSPAANALAAELSLNRTASLDVVRVEASNSKAIGIAELPLTAAGKLEPESSKRSLFVAAIGASQFKDTRIPTLKFAAKDAEAIGELLRANKGSAYQEVHTLILSDEGRDGRPLRATIAERLPPFLRQARAQDTVIVFLASHGLSNARGDYFFVPLDASREDLDQAKLGAGDAGSLLPWQFFAQLLADSAGRRVLIVDTCAAAAIEGSSFDAYSLAKRSTASKFALLAASTGKELSQESAVHLHGLFTFGLLDAIETAADTNEAGVVTLKDAFQHARDLVEAQHNRAVGTQTPQAVIPEVLESIPLGRRTGLVN